MRYLPRQIEKTLRQAARQFPAVILTGPRQSGKTTTLQHLFSKTHRYVSLDDPDSRRMAQEDPNLFLKNFPPPVAIDEVQYGPGLFPHLKIQIDQNRSRKGRFLLTGSQIFPLMAGITESLAGRIAVLSLLSLSLKEIFQQRAAPQPLETLKDRILKGGYPEVALSRRGNPRLWHASYLQTYLERDVRQLRQIGDLTDFQRFVELLASFNGQVLHLSNLSRDLGVSVNTVKSWVSILEATHQIVLIKPFYKNRGKRLIKAPKVYFLDTGFLCYLNGITQANQVFKGPTAGSLLETAVLGELLREFYAQGEVPRIFWWRTSDGEEVDFIVEKRGRLIPMEVKLSTRQNREMIRGLFSFVELFRSEVERAYLVNMADRPIALHDRIHTLPFEILLRRTIV